MGKSQQTGQANTSNTGILRQKKKKYIKLHEKK